MARHGTSGPGVSILCSEFIAEDVLHRLSFVLCAFPLPLRWSGLMDTFVDVFLASSESNLEPHTLLCTLIYCPPPPSG